MVDQKDHTGYGDDHIIKNVLQHEAQEQDEHENALLVEIKDQMLGVGAFPSNVDQTTEQGEYRKEKEYEER